MKDNSRTEKRSDTDFHHKVNDNTNNTYDRLYML